MQSTDNIVWDQILKTSLQIYKSYLLSVLSKTYMISLTLLNFWRGAAAELTNIGSYGSYQIMSQWMMRTLQIRDLVHLLPLRKTSALQ